jgi:filamentous hemagglutinin family protein
MSQVLSRLMKNKFAQIFLGFGLIQVCLSHSVAAQIVPDRTLQDNSQVQVNGELLEITGGTENGTNLFHSFEQFSVPTGNTAYFNHGLTIENIFSRVTGGSISKIDGLIQANGIANLFLINPNGIIFGQNARLNIGGSFLASTAESVVWPDGISWNARNPNPAPLLNINVPIGLQVGANPGEIVVEGEPIERTISTNIQSPAELESAIAFQESLLPSADGLQVQPGETLALLGGNITLNSGLIKTKQGRIELGSLQSEGFVGLTFNSSDTNGALSLDYDYANIPEFGNIHILDQAIAIASGEGGGDIQIVGRNLLVTNGSNIVAGTLGTQPGGNINIRTTDSVELFGSSPEQQNRNLVGAGTYGSGDSGNLTIDTGRLIVRDGSEVGSGSFAAGNSGNVMIRAAESVEVNGMTPNGQSRSAIGAIAQGTGNAGDVTIDTNQLMVREGAQVAVNTFGAGQGGNIHIQARSTVGAIGSNRNTPVASALVAETYGSGDAGNLTIETEQLTVQGGAKVGAGTFADGNGGEVMIRSSDSVDISGSGVSSDRENPSFVGAIAQSTGDAGNITIETGQLIVRDGAVVAVGTENEGQAGNLTIRARNTVEIMGRSSNDRWPSTLGANTNGTGNAGNITIDTGQLIVRDGAQVTLETIGEGDAGNLEIQATDKIEVFHPSLIYLEQLPLAFVQKLETFMPENQSNPSSNLTAVEIPTIRAATFGSGNAGNVQIETRQLIIREGGGIFAGSFAEGQGGNLMVNASESIDIEGSFVNPVSIQGLGSTTFANGNAGDTTINTARLVIQQGGEVVVGTFGAGNGGTLNVNASELVELTGTAPDDSTESSELSAETRGMGNAGDVIINTPQLLVSDRATVSVSGEATGNPGSIEVNASEIFLTDDGSSIAATSATGQGGNISLRSPDIQLRNSSNISAYGSQTGNITLEGNINLNTEILVLFDDSQIITDAADPRGGSNITIDAIDGSELVVFQSADSLINARGKLEIDTEINMNQGKIFEVEFTDITQLISRGCEAIAQGSTFTMTGRGGLPPKPEDLLSPPRSMVQWTNREDLTFSEVNSPDLVSPQFPEQENNAIGHNRNHPIIEATGFMVAADGTVRLVASPNFVDYSNLNPMQHPNCVQ